MPTSSRACSEGGAARRAPVRVGIYGPIWSPTSVPTLDGRVRVKVRPGSQIGHTLRVRRKGVARKDRTPGDLYVHLAVVAPDGEVPDAVLSALAAACTNDVRSSLWEVR